MWRRLVELLCPPVHFGLHGQWPGFVLTTIALLEALLLVWLGFTRWAVTPRSFWFTGPTEFIFAGLLWVLAVGRALAGTRRVLGPLVTVFLVVTMLAASLARIDEVSLHSRYAANQGTIEALRSAIAIYYGKYGDYPERPERYVERFQLACPGSAYAYDRATGAVRVTSTNTIDDCL